jgi:hypothetical protein
MEAAMTNNFAPLGNVREFVRNWVQHHGAATDDADQTADLAESMRRNLSGADPHLRSIDQMSDADVLWIRQELKKDAAFRRIMDTMDEDVQLAVLGQMTNAKLWRMLCQMTVDDVGRLLRKIEDEEEEEDYPMILIKMMRRRTMTKNAEPEEDEDREAEEDDDEKKKDDDQDDEDEVEERDRINDLCIMRGYRVSR